MFTQSCESCMYFYCIPSNALCLYSGVCLYEAIINASNDVELVIDSTSVCSDWIEASGGAMDAGL